MLRHGALRNRASSSYLRRGITPLAANGGVLLRSNSRNNVPPTLGNGRVYHNEPSNGDDVIISDGNNVVCRPM